MVVFAIWHQDKQFRRVPNIREPTAKLQRFVKRTHGDKDKRAIHSSFRGAGFCIKVVPRLNRMAGEISRAVRGLLALFHPYAVCRRNIGALVLALALCLAVCAIDCSSLSAAITTGGGTETAVDALGPQRFPGFVGLLGRLHPLVVHFPIALIIMAGVSEAFFVRNRDTRYGFAARLMLSAAALFAFVAVLLGIAAASVRIGTPTGAGVGLHGALGMITTGLVAVTAALAAGSARSSDPSRVLLYRILLVASMISVIFAAHTGARLVFGPGYISIF